MKVSKLIPLVTFLCSFFALSAQDTLESKGAIIIASLEGQVSVINNETQEPLPASQVKAGGLLVDGHTVKTGPASKVILLLSNGTVSTIKSESALNIKKFTQEKFDSSGMKLSQMKGEPSSSDTVLDLELGDMIFDVKKLDKKSSFNIESPVGTAGIRGTSGQMGVSSAGGATNLNINMFKGTVAAQLKGQSVPTFVRQGQSFAAGISASGVMLPPVLGKVSPTLLASIEADLEASGDLTGVTSVDDPVAPAGEAGDNVEDEAPSEEELQEQDAEQAAAAKGVDDNGSSEAVALDKAGLIDLDDAEKLEKVDTYVKVSKKSADKFDEKIKERRAGRRNSGDKSDSEFLSDLVGNFDDVVDVTVEAESIGLESEAMFDSLLENSENSGAVKEVVTVAAEIGAKDKDSLASVFVNVDQADAVKEVVSVASEIGAKDKANLGSVFKNADKAEDLKEVVTVASEIGAKDVTNLGSVLKNADKADSLNKVMKVAKEAIGTEATPGGGKKLDSSSLDILSSTLQNADKAADLAEVMDAAEELGAQDATNLTNVFKNADKADSLNKVMKVAKETLGTDKDGEKKLDSSALSILSSTLQNADKAADLAEVMDVAAELGAQSAENLTSVFQNADKADDLKEVMNAAKNSLGTDDGSGVKKLDQSHASFLTDTLKNADKASEMKAATDQLSSLGSDADAASLFTNLVDVGTVIKTAKDNGVEDVELIRNMARNPNNAKKVQEVFETVGTSVDADAAKNILGNVDKVEEMQTALQNVGGKVSDLGAFIKKDITELVAVNEVVESLGENADAFLDQGIDEVLQVKELLDSNLITATDFDTVEGADPIDFTAIVKNKSLSELQVKFSSNSDFIDIINVNQDRSQDILFVTNLIDPSQYSSFFGNIDKLDSIMHLSHKFRPIEAVAGEELTAQQIQSNDVRHQRLSTVFNNLDVAVALDELITEFGVYPSRMDIIFDNADLAPSILETVREYEGTGSQPNPDAGRLIENLFSSDDIRSFLSEDGLNDLTSQFPDYYDEIIKNGAIAAEIKGLISIVGDEHAPAVLENLNRFDDLEKLVFRSGQKPDNLDALFRNLSRMNDILELSNLMSSQEVSGGQNAIFSNLDLLFGEQAESGYLLLAFDNPKFFVKIFEQSGDLSKVSSVLATELEALDLNRDELTKVLSDLLDGPSSDAPATQPPSSDGLSEEFAAVTILETHAFNGEIPQNLVLSEEQVRASNLFQETLDVFDALGELSPSSETDSQPNTSTGLIGGVNLIFDSGSYDLSNYGFGSYLIAASESISLSGNLSFASSQNVEELMFISSGPFKISDGASVDFSGNSLGFGSFDTIEIMNVGLFAGGEIGVRSLDSIIIKDSEFATRGSGADLIHLIAAADLSIDNLRFSEQVRQITMEAMTINLSNLNFPAGSKVNLNSAYGGIDGVYPNFGSSAVGRVNFIENIKYNSHLLNSRSAFDLHGGNIAIGTFGN